MSEFPVVGIGASAGGIDAFHTFFSRMPADCGMAFVVILHLPIDRKSMLAEILALWTPMRVQEVTGVSWVEPNCVYVPLPGAIVSYANSHLCVRMPDQDELRARRPIDAFFDSLGSSVGERAVGIVLSGTGSDGALGLKAIKGCGGLTIAQGTDGSTPQYREMPAGAIATGAVDLVATVEDIPEQLLRIKADVSRSSAMAEEPPPGANAARLEICAILRAQLGHDFSGYRDKTFLRRVQRRMQVLNAATLDEYIARLRIDRAEAESLFRDLLIRVTSFFRDQATFQVLETIVMPRLFAGKTAENTVRVWVPGCASGEEAYSLAILLREQMDKQRGTPKVQLFATDIDESAICAARLGRYPETLLEGLSAERRRRFFSASQGGYVISREIRDLCTFSMHNLVRDPPFSRMNLVSCRNLLIYLDVTLQAAVIPLFHYSLVPDGILLLGGAESAAKHEQLFEPLDKAARIFKRRDTSGAVLTLNLQRTLSLQRPDSGARGQRTTSSAQSDTRSGDGSNVHSGQFRQPLGNEPAPPGRAQATFRSRVESLFRRLSMNGADETELQSELLAARGELQSLAEEHQTALEELRSSNEELQSVNEEMQSTNEELETSKEELQSVNEELHTVNLRLSEKIDELDAANNDLRNLFDSTEIATIFLDRNLIIRSFTTAIATLYNLIPSDQGRPLTDIVSRLHYDDLASDVASVLETLRPLERRVAREDQSAHYIMRILPYRESDSAVSGVLVTFVDVTSIVQAEAALVESDLRKDVFLATLSHELRNPLAPIRTAARLLQSPNLESSELARAQAIITRQVAHMSSLLDDLLDVSRITRGVFLLRKSHIDIRAIVGAAVEAAQPAIDAKDHTLSIELPQTPILLDADSVRLTQVVSNLLFNSAKYTASGGLLSLTARLDPQGLIIVVRDNGIGIASAMLTRVFNMFTRAHSDVHGADQGLGIGLALVKGLVELHGGHIEARSAGLGKGSEFVVTLPDSLIVPPSPGETAGEGISGTHVPRRKVLIADDNRDGAETLGMFLELSGHEVHLAHSGARALEMARELRPHIAVLDIGMPDMSGYEVAKSIRREEYGMRMTLIALTGWGHEEDKRRAHAAGFDHHMTKPIDPEDLERLFAPAEIDRK